MKRLRHWLWTTLMIGPLLFVAARNLVRILNRLEKLTMTVKETLDTFTSAVEAGLAKINTDLDTLIELGRNGLTDAELAAFNTKAEAIKATIQTMDDKVPDPVP